jgi:hypothetical protein
VTIVWLSRLQTIPLVALPFVWAPSTLAFGLINVLDVFHRWSAPSSPTPAIVRPSREYEAVVIFVRWPGCLDLTTITDFDFAR